VLPAPLGYHVDGVFVCGKALCSGEPCPAQSCNYTLLHDRSVARLPQGPLRADLPTPCGPGFFGNSTEVSDQSSALCSSVCPAGFVCPHPATVHPELVPNGFWSSAGSFREEVCPPGVFANSTRPGDRSSSLCSGLCPAGFVCPNESTVSPVAVPKGFYSSTGATRASACGAGTFGKLELRDGQRTSLEAACQPCPFNTTTLGTGLASPDGCVCQPKFFDDLGRNESEAIDNTTGARTCSSCPRGFDCNQYDATSLTANVSVGFWRPSLESIESKRCPYRRLCAGGLSSGQTCKPSFNGAYCTGCLDPNQYLNTVHISAPTSGQQ